MEKKTFGNDANFALHLKQKNDEPLDFSGSTIRVFLVSHTAARQYEITDFIAANGNISFTYMGKDQHHLGIYDIKVYLNYMAAGMMTITEPEAFELVEFNRDAGGIANPNLDIETTDIDMTVTHDISGVLSVNGKTGKVAISASDLNVYTKIESDEKYATKEEIPVIPDIEISLFEKGKLEADYALIDIEASGHKLTLVKSRFLQKHQDISGKVDKIRGKGLSTEDFTTVLKEKLERLENYNDEEVRTAIASLTTSLNTLMSGDPTAAIESFNEIIAFLANVEDTETLEGIIAALNTTINQKVAQADYNADKLVQATKDSEQDTAIGRRVKISDYNTDKEGFALKTELAPVSQKADTNESAITTINEKDEAQDGRLTTLETASATQGTALETQAESIAAILRKADEHGLSIEALSNLIDNAGHHKALSYDAEDEYKVCGHRTVLYGAGVPSEETIPDQHGIPAFVGQLYIDTSSDTGGLYYAVGTGSVSSWKKA